MRREELASKSTRFVVCEAAARARNSKRAVTDAAKSGSACATVRQASKYGRRRDTVTEHRSELIVGREDPVHGETVQTTDDKAATPCHSLSDSNLHK